MAKIKVTKVGFLNSSGEREIYKIPDSSSSASIRLFSSVGVYEGDDLESTLGLTPMPGYNDPFNDNYGNYKNSDGSVFVFIPKFYYTFDCKPEETYYQDTLTYSDLSEKQLAQIVTRSPMNYMVMASGKVFKNEAEANKHGFILHRAFIDGGQEKSGFFIAKYLASRGTDGTSTRAMFVKNGKTISLTTDSNYQPSSNMPNCKGNGYDAIILSKAINPNLNCASAFMYSALAMQSKFIGTIVTSTDQCAWYDPNLIMNFPKGCHGGSLSDANDFSVKYTAQVQGSNKPLTGSGSPFNKTTHNGLNNGVCDLSGCMDQKVTGVGWSGSRVLRESSKLSDITTDNVNNTSASIYDTNSSYASYLHRWGNSSSSSWRKATNGLSRALEGIYPVSDSAGCSTDETNEFGQDLCRSASDHSALLCSASWSFASDAGIFHRSMSYWQQRNAGWGFRSGGYALN